MLIKTLPVGPLQANCYILKKDETSPAVIIDPGAEGERILSALCGIPPAAILLTHGHFDHTGALSAFPDAETVIHETDAGMLTDPQRNAGALFGDTLPRRPATRTVKEGDVLSYGGLEITVLHTPGHTPGSVCYSAEGCLFTGDTLFHRGYGRTDLPGGSVKDLIASLRRLLHTEGDPAFYPGHGEGAHISDER